MKFEAFDTAEEMFEAISEAEAAANAAVRDWQQSIGWGDCWIANHREIDIVVFGEVAESLEKLTEQELELGASQAEAEYTAKTMQDSFERGYRFGTAYSAPYPDGELGSTHISTMVPLSRNLFELAREFDWKCGQQFWDFAVAAVNIAEATANLGERLIRELLLPKQ